MSKISGDVDMVISDIYTLKKVDNMGTLTSSNFWNFPSFPRIICGTGHSLYEAQGYHYSDVGYINELWIDRRFLCGNRYGRRPDSERLPVYRPPVQGRRVRPHDS